MSHSILDVTVDSTDEDKPSDGLVSEGVIQELNQIDSSDLYGLAERVLSELIPEWNDDDSSNEEEGYCSLDDEVDDFQEEIDIDGQRFFTQNVNIVDQSYCECIREVERYLVEQEGFSEHDDNLLALRRHLENARENALKKEMVQMIKTNFSQVDQSDPNNQIRMFL